MKRLLKLWLVLGLLIPCASPLSARNNITVEISDENPTQGSLIEVRIRPGDCTPKVFFDSTRVPLLQGEASRVGLLGVDLESDPGTKTLTVKHGNCSRRDQFPIRRQINVRAGQFDVERLTVEDTGEVVLSKKAQRRHRRESRRIEKALDRLSPIRHWTANFHPPVKESNYPGNDNFGTRRFINGRPRSPHSGEDYPADVGDPVFAINHGQIVLTGNFFFSGKSVFVDHGRGLFSMYFHLSEIDVYDGEFVLKGQPIGKAGSTGRVTGPHLHLGVQWMDARVDPSELYSPSLGVLHN